MMPKFKMCTIHDAQVQKMLLNLGVEDLCRMRCVCREWCDVIQRRDFRGMYDVANSSQLEPRPVICYLESSYPLRLECSAYDYEGRMWKKMKNFPSTRPQRCLTTLNTLAHDNWPLNVRLYSVGGLLCLHRWSFRCGVVSTRGMSSSTVWNPFRNRWKKLLLCDYKLSGELVTTSNMLPFVHVFVSDERTKAHKILMALHYEVSNSHDFEDNERKLATKIYDSRTGMWTDGAEHTLGVEVIYSKLSSSRGVHCNGLVYFVAEIWVNNGRGNGPIMRPSVLLAYDIGVEEWIEQPLDSYLPLFEWDGRLMTVDVDNAVLGIEQDFLEWEPERWNDTGIKLPGKIGKVFHRDLRGFSIVASFNSHCRNEPVLDCNKMCTYRVALDLTVESHRNLQLQDRVEQPRICSSDLNKRRRDSQSIEEDIFKAHELYSILEACIWWSTGPPPEGTQF